VCLIGLPDVVTKLRTEHVYLMKATARIVDPRESSRPANRQARREIQSFLRALGSYPERFSRDPDVTFEQHLSGLDKGSDTGVDEGEDRAAE
jgi:hypothetical protein